MLSAEKGQRTLRVLPPASPLSRDVQAFLIDRQARGLSPRTIAYYAEKIRPLVTSLERDGVREVRDIAPDHLRRYLLAQGMQRSPGGLHGLYRTARAFLRWWEAETEPEGWRNPIGKVPAPQVRQEVLDPVSMEHLRAMLATCRRRTFSGDRDRALMLALLDTGCRASEFLALNLGDLDTGTGSLSLRRTKGGRPRTVFVGRTTLRDVSRYLRHLPDASPAGPLWVTRDSTRIRYSGLVSLLRRRAKNAGVPAPLSHAFRRAFALASLRRGIDVLSLQRLLGHADLSVISRYTKQTQEDLRAVHEQHSPVDSLIRG